MKYFLHLDTSADTSTVAIGLEGKLICYSRNEEPRNHAAALNLMIQDMMAEAGITFRELSAVVVCAGPGSYTGLRIGMATAKGICYALDIPLLADNKLTLLAYQAYALFNQKYKHYIPILQAREKEYFIGIFDEHFVNTFPASHISENQLNTLFAGKENMYVICALLPAEINEKHAENAYLDNTLTIDLNSWVFYAFGQYVCNKTVNLSTSEPFYLKQVYTHK